MNKQLFLSKTDDQSLCYGVFDWCGWPELNASYSKRALGPWSPIIAKAPLWRSTCRYQVLWELSLGVVGWGMVGCNYTCMWRASEGNEVWRMLPSQRVVPPSTVTPISLPLCLRLVTRVAPVHPPRTPPPTSPLLYPCLDNRMGFSGGLEVAPTPVVPAKQAPRAASNYFITLHQIKSNKLITNDCGHASSKYRINIIDLILSMLSEKLINAGAKITALFSRATATIGWIKRSHEVHSSKVNSSDASAIHTETLG